MIEIKVNGVKFETDSPLKAFAFATAIEFYNLSEEQAIEATKLSHMIYIETLYDVSLVRLVDQVCENIDNYISLEFLEVMEDVLKTVAEYDL